MELSIFNIAHKLLNSVIFDMKKMTRSAGFTLIEIIITIVILGIISSVAVVKYQDIGLESKKSSCRSALGGMRSAISLYYSSSALKFMSADWPELDSMRTVGVVMEFAIPPNPFQLPDRAPDSIVEGVTPGVTVGNRGGWAYKPSTGEIWANTNTTVSGDGCSGPADIHENEW